MMKKRSALMMSSVLLMSVVLAACGGNNNNTASNTAQNGSAGNKSGETKTVKIFQFKTEIVEGLNELKVEFEKKTLTSSWISKLSAVAQTMQQR